MNKPQKNGLIIVLILVIIGAGIFYYYRYYKDASTPQESGENQQIDERKMFEFEIKNDDLSDEIKDEYFNRFQQAKEKIINNPQALNPSSWAEMARMKKYVDDYEGAEQIYLYVLGKTPDNYMMLGNLADLYLNYLKDYEKAVEVFWRAFEGAGSNDTVKLSHLRSLADIYADQLVNKREEFESRIDEIEENFKQNVDFYTLVAKYYRETEQYEKSIEYLIRAQNIGPNNQAIQDEIQYLQSKLK